MKHILKDIDKALKILGDKFNTTEAKRLMLAIGFQESGFKHRKQIGGPAHGFWQFEKGGGVVGVMKHHSTKRHAKEVCEALNVPFELNAIYHALVDNDLLSASFARLLLWPDPKGLPNNSQQAWEYYIRMWRPGAYLRGFKKTKEQPYPEMSKRWPANWKKANQLIQNEMNTQLYIVFHNASHPLPSGLSLGCSETADEWSKTFVYLTETEAETLATTHTVAFVGKRPDDRG